MKGNWWSSSNDLYERTWSASSGWASLPTKPWWGSTTPSTSAS